MTAPGHGWKARLKDRLVERMNIHWWQHGTIPLRLRVVWHLLRLGGA
jgi:hypothetical protein